MPSDARDIFVAGLKDAYAMEKQAKDMMTSQADRLEDYPMVRERAAQHAQETDRQIARLERALEVCGESPSALKNLALRTAGNIQAMMHGAASDEPIKDAISGYAFEHFEIASYRNLIVMAEALGENEIADLGRQSLQEEIAMADWLDEHMDELARQFMNRAGAGTIPASRSEAHSSLST